MIIKRHYHCEYCNSEFYVFQPLGDEKIVHCPSCEKTNLNCDEKEIKNADSN